MKMFDQPSTQFLVHCEFSSLC